MKNIIFYIIFAFLLISLIMVVRPFLQILILAAVLVILFQPLHLLLLKYSGQRKNITSLVSSIIILLIIIIPVLLFINILTIEIKNVVFDYIRAEDASQDIITFWDEGVQTIDNILPFDVNLINDEIISSFTNTFDLDNLNSLLIENIRKLRPVMFTDAFSGLIKIFINIFIFLIALFYFNRDQEKIYNYLFYFSPLEENNTKLLITKFKQTIKAVLIGSLLIAILQGFLTGLGFNIINLPQPILWGIIAGIASIIPSIGPALIILPTAGILLWSGNISATLFILFWGFVIVGPIDYYLRPLLIGREINIHPLLILISVLGGIAYFGTIGFVLGPIILSACLALGDMHVKNMKT